jgi:hypothetical protein
MPMRRFLSVAYRAITLLGDEPFMLAASLTIADQPTSILPLIILSSLVL